MKSARNVTYIFHSNETIKHVLLYLQKLANEKQQDIYPVLTNMHFCSA